jgi:hypothetical protein
VTCTNYVYGASIKGKTRGRVACCEHRCIRRKSRTRPKHAVTSKAATIYPRMPHPRPRLTCEHSVVAKCPLAYCTLQSQQYSYPQFLHVMWLQPPSLMVRAPLHEEPALRGQPGAGASSSRGPGTQTISGRHLDGMAPSYRRTSQHWQAPLRSAPRLGCSPRTHTCGKKPQKIMRKHCSLLQHTAVCRQAATHHAGQAFVLERSQASESTSSNTASPYLARSASLPAGERMGSGERRI